MIGQTIYHYKITEHLGSGGMGVVYKAQDLKLDRPVALKFLPTTLTSDCEAKQRFIQEAKAASRLDHPNICNIYEINETEDGQLFIAMACYEGETLDKIIEGGQIDVQETIDIVLQIAAGLNKAHQKGIIHRDIKPANILITEDGVVKILDFGIAKLSGQSRLTEVDKTVGTVTYMSPEQTKGENVDHKTDIWALGVILYEMLTGQLPFKGDYEQAVIYSILNEEAKSPSQLRSDIPGNIETIILKTLEKNKEERYEDVQALMIDLKAPSHEITAKSKKEISIIVLPFVNISPDPEQEYFSDGLTEEIISDLSRIHDLLVISRSSAMTFKGTSKKTREIAREVNVRYVLEGSVRKAGNNLRITAQLIDAHRDVHLWSDKYSGTLDDAFDIQEKVSCSIVDALKIRLSPEERKNISEHPFQDVRAYECYLKANTEILKFTKDSTSRAIQYLQNAYEIIGDNPFLFSGMAMACWQLVNLGLQQEDYLEKAAEYARKALAIDSDFPQAHVVLGFISFFGEPRKVVYHMKRTLAVSPDDNMAMALLGFVYSHYFGKLSSALPISKRLQRIAPLDFPTNALSSSLYFYDGQFDRTLEEWKKLYEMYPENAYSQFWYALILVYHNENNKALSIIENMVKENKDTALAKLALILKYVCQNNTNKALEIMTEDFQKTCLRDATYCHHIAGFFAMLNEKEIALDWLDNAVNVDFLNYPLLAKDPFLENVRGEKRFKELLERVKHEWENLEL